MPGAPAPSARSRGRDLGIGGDDVDPVVRPARSSARPARADRRGRLVRADDRAARDVGARAADQAATAGRGRAPRGRRRASRSVAASRDAARCAAQARRLVDVAARAVDHEVVPALELGRADARGRSASSARSSASVPSPGRRRGRRRRQAVATASQPRPAAARLVDRAAERVQGQVPGADVAHLAAAEPGLEVGDPAGRQAPQVVARGALLTRRPDGLPLEQVVRPAVVARRRSSRRTAPRPAARSARGTAWRAARRPRLRRTAAGRRPAGRIRVPDVAIGGLGPDEEPGPVGRLAVDPIELGQAVAVGVDDRDARRRAPC